MKGKTEQIISTSRGNSAGENKELGFAYREIKGNRSAQEDAVAWEVFAPMQDLSPIEMGHRLWTAYKILNDSFKKKDASSRVTDQLTGTTASTTIISNDHLITATLADTVAFAVIYNLNGRVVGVQRLNQVIHTPGSEKARITSERACMAYDNNRIFIEQCVFLAVSRRIGNSIAGVCADATVDTYSIYMVSINCNHGPQLTTNPLY